MEWDNMDEDGDEDEDEDGMGWDGMGWDGMGWIRSDEKLPRASLPPVPFMFEKSPPCTMNPWMTRWNRVFLKCSAFCVTLPTPRSPCGHAREL